MSVSYQTFDGPLLLAVEIDDPRSLPKLHQLTAAMGATSGVAEVAPPQLNQAHDAAIIQVIPTTSPQDQATSDLVRRLRDVQISYELPEGAIVHVGGGTATFIDLSDRITNALPWFIGAVVFLSFLLLMVVFRSLLVPLKAAILNLLSIGASYGVIVVIFLWGWGRSLLGIDKPVPVVSFVPMFMFAVLFGLSMDYEVFLLSRVREEYLRSGNNVKSVVTESRPRPEDHERGAHHDRGLPELVTEPDPVAQMFGIGLAVAVFIDATIVRIVLVPATMVLLGDANWWLPPWLDRMLPKMQLEVTEVPELEGEPIPVA
jgi:RND superfamily putative drug exporter